MRKMKNLIGEKFGRLLVIERSEDYIQFNGKKRSYWKCRCECGKEQARNTSRNKLILWNGETKCLSEWEEITELPIKKRLRDGWSLEKSFLTPKRKRTERKQNETFNVSISCV